MLEIKLLHKLIRSCSAFTLLEVAVATSILTLGLGLIGTSVFQVLSGANQPGS